jgi:hypothetical protein
MSPFIVLKPASFLSMPTSSRRARVSSLLTRRSVSQMANASACASRRSRNRSRQSSSRTLIRPNDDLLFLMRLSGNDSGAKQTVRELVETFGWTDAIDLGDIATARATENYLPLWLSVWKRLGTPAFNIKVVR